MPYKEDRDWTIFAHAGLNAIRNPSSTVSFEVRSSAMLVKLLPPCRGEIHGRKLRNNAKLTQLVLALIDMTCSPIPYYVELINSKLP